MLGTQGIIKELKDSFSFVLELSTQQIETLAECTTLQEVPANTVLVKKIGSCQGLALIVAGGLRVYRTSCDGREVTIYRIGKGRTCPLSAVCIMGNLEGFEAKVVAEVDTKILWVSRDFVIKNLFECEPFSRFIFNCMANRLYETMEVVDNIAFDSIKKRLAQILITKSSFGKHQIYTTHDALARELGTAREVISRQLKVFERAGFLTLFRGRLTVENVEELSALTGNNS